MAVELQIDEVSIQIGMIIQKNYFRYTLSTTVCLYKSRSMPLIFLKLIDYPDQRLEVHPNSIEEIIQQEGLPIYYFMLKQRPSLSRKDLLKDYWNPEIFEMGTQDPFLQLFYPHFLVLRLRFQDEPQSLLKVLRGMKVRISLGYYQDISAELYPIPLVQLFWLLPWTTKYSIMILLTNRMMTIDDITYATLMEIKATPNSGALLEYMFVANIPFTLESFREVSDRTIPQEKIPEGHVTVRKVLISPSAMVFLPHEIDLGNRVVREMNPDDLLRINFVDEYNERSIWSNCTSVLGRFKNILKGFSLLGRYYEFLGFSNSQMRNHSCWMVRVTKNLNAEKLRSKLGDFSKCKSVCKYASRLGLCFSGTHKALDIAPSQIAIMPDIESYDKKYVFSDGVGMIADDLFEKVLRNVYVKERQKISALQVRICGCKGVLTRTPEISNEIYVRKSMNKFDSEHFKLEICSYAVSRPGYLNRQIILILNGLGIDNQVFETLQNTMIKELQITLSSEAAAEDYLRKTDPTYYRDLIYMLQSNMKFSDDVYLRGMISAVFLAAVKMIKSKARILAPKSSLLMGVLDEYGVLEYGEVFIQITAEDSSEIITGRIAVAKNPCYHPGDIRVLEAVRRPQLMHLHNVIVFPQKGPRPHPNECSGSDLDGDLYFVTWNHKLVPAHHVEPMNYDAPKEKEELNPINIEKVIDFFGTFMESENIGRISNAHLIIADKKGVHSREALELAGLTSIAVDYPKTGIPAILRPELRASAWPDFMEKTGKTSYESTGIIGILYRSCTLDSFDFNFAYSVNKSLLLRGYEIYLPFAKQLYNLYSGKIHKLMRQYQSENEFFLLTVQNGENSKRKMRYEDDIQVQSLVSYFKEEVCSMFRDKTTDLLERRKIASACYFHVYSKPKTSSIKHVCLSFPWIFHDYLV